VKLVYSEELPTRAEAMQRERQIKKYPHAKKLELSRQQRKRRKAGLP
jgi:predicted GIY-YIG superfamily endonuclease